MTNSTAFVFVISKDQLKDTQEKHHLWSYNDEVGAFTPTCNQNNWRKELKDFSLDEEYSLQGVRQLDFFPEDICQSCIYQHPYFLKRR